MNLRHLQPDSWPKPKGYSNGVLAGNGLIFLAGQIGWDEKQSFADRDFVGQCRQALENILAVLAEAGASAEHIVRLTWFITDRQAYLDNTAALGAAYRDVMGRNFPPMSVVEVSALMEAEAMVEIEATALAPAAS